MAKAPTPRALAVSKPPAKPLAVKNIYVSELVGAGKPFSKLGLGLGYKLTKNYTVPANTNLIIGKSGSNNGNGNIVINGGKTITISSGSSITFVPTPATMGKPETPAILDQSQFINCKIIGVSTTKKGALKGKGTILNGTTGIVDLEKVSKGSGIKINTDLKQTYLSDAAYSQYIVDTGVEGNGYSLKKDWTLPQNTNVIIGKFNLNNVTINPSGGSLNFNMYDITVPKSSSITFKSESNLFSTDNAYMLIETGSKLDVFGKLLGTGLIEYYTEGAVVIETGGSKGNITIKKAMFFM